RRDRAGCILLSGAAHAGPAAGCTRQPGSCTGRGDLIMVIVGRIQRYIFRENVMSLLLTLGVIVLAIVLVDVVEQMRTIGSRKQIGLDTAFTLTLMKTPGLVLETLPFAMLVSSIMTLSQLSRRSEIPAFRAAGVSAWRFLGPTMFLAIGLGVVMVTLLDPLATRLTSEFEAARERILN